ncbi:MAG: hypothetical protein ACKVTZ_12670, partial [Bacteroidia bacterium]
MKQITPFFFLCLLFVCAAMQAQNWKPIALNEKYHYQGLNLNDGDISYTAFVDSSYVMNGDSVFVMSDIYHGVNNNMSYEKALSPFYDQITQKPNGEYVFTNLSNNQSFVLSTQAKLNDTWLFDATNNLTATVIAISEENIFPSVSDSIKTIQISNNTTYRLSKSHGLLLLPDIGLVYSTINVFSLVGLENAGLGLQVPKAKEIYNFNIGDIYQYDITNYWGTSYQGSHQKGYEKHQIVGKIVFADSVRFEVKVASFMTHTQKQQGSTTSSYDEAKTETKYFTYSFRAASLANAYPLQLGKELITGALTTVVCKGMQLDSMNLANKKNLLLYPGIYSRTYTQSLGMTHDRFDSSSPSGSYHLNRDLVAYYQVGKDTVGTILPDAYFEANAWYPLPKMGEHYHYQFLANNETQRNNLYTAWIDSTYDDNFNDKAYFLPSIHTMPRVGTSVTLPNCLGEKVTYGAGYYTFRENNLLKFRLNVGTSIGRQWSFDSATNIIAQTVAYKRLPIAYNRNTNQMETDSVQIIALTTGDTVKLSEHYGIIDFPDYINHKGHHILYGIEEQPIGRKMPVYEDFSLAVGDSLEYVYEYNWSAPMGHGGYKKTRFQCQVISANVDTYLLKGKKVIFEKNGWYESSEETSTLLKEEIDTLLFTQNHFNTIKGYPGHARITAYETSQNDMVKQYDMPTLENMYAQEGLGFVHTYSNVSLSGGGGGHNEMKLVAYRKTNGKYGGTFSDDKVFTEKTIDLIVEMYPNPVANELYFA